MDSAGVAQMLVAQSVPFYYSAWSPKVDGGTEPVLASNGKTLYYRHRRQVLAVGVTAGQTLGVGMRRV